MKPKKMPGSPQEWLSHAKSDLRLAHLAATDELVRRPTFSKDTSSTFQETMARRFTGRFVGSFFTGRAASKW